MMMMLLNSLRSWCQSDTIHHPLRGSITDVTIDIGYIRQANDKLIEHKYCSSIINTKDSIIALHNDRFRIADSIYNAKLQYTYAVARKLEEDVEKANKRKKIWAGTAIGAVLAFFVVVLIK